MKFMHIQRVMLLFSAKFRMRSRYQTSFEFPIKTFPASKEILMNKQVRLAAEKEI